MPIYEYQCRSCRRQFSVLHRSFALTTPVACRNCGGADVQRLISQVALLRSGDVGPEGLGDDALAGVDENDPQSVARWARKMGRQLGDEAGPEWGQMIDRMEEGELPDAQGDDEGLDSGIGGDEF